MADTPQIQLFFPVFADHPEQTTEYYRFKQWQDRNDGEIVPDILSGPRPSVKACFLKQSARSGGER